jgi:hypothetical protein
LSTGQGHKEKNKGRTCAKEKYNIYSFLSKGFYVCKRKVLGGEKGKK